MTKSPGRPSSVQSGAQADLKKKRLRHERWIGLATAGAARFPGTFGRIPNFKGAERAAEILSEQAIFRRAEWLKCNPDMPQRPVRHRALKAGKRIYMAVPKLAGKKPFLLLDPRKLDSADLWKASSIRGALELGRPVTLKQVQPIDLVVTGCVGVSPNGSRLGKGGGYADLEYACLREVEKVSARTPIVTTVHTTQILRDDEVPMLRHDVSLDGYATAEGWVGCRRKHRRPKGIFWDQLDQEKRHDIPCLARGGF